MLRTIYRLKQSALEWYHKVCGVILGLEFHRTEMDHVLFYYDEVSSTADQVHTRCFVGWHIDDGMATSNNLAFLIYVKKCIADRFGLTDLGLVIKYLGVQFKCNCPAGFIWLHQAECISFLLQEYNLEGCNPVILPADPNHPLGDPSATYPEVLNL